MLLQYLTGLIRGSCSNQERGAVKSRDSEQAHRGGHVVGHVVSREVIGSGHVLATAMADVVTWLGAVARLTAVSVRSIEKR